MAGEIMFYGGMAGTVLFGIAAVILFFVFRIYAVAGELTGITARRSIRRIQKEEREGKSRFCAIRENTDKLMVKSDRTAGRLQFEKKKQTGADRQALEETVLWNRIQEGETVVLNSKPEAAATVKLSWDAPAIRKNSDYSREEWKARKV